MGRKLKKNNKSSTYAMFGKIKFKQQKLQNLHKQTLNNCPQLHGSVKILPNICNREQEEIFNTQQCANKMIMPSGYSNVIIDTQLSKDIDNSLNHVFGDHHNCCDYFCNKKEERNYLQELGPTIKSELKMLINRLSRNSKSLLIDVDSNVAERFNSIIAKTVGGKRINFSTGQSYRYRCHAAVVQHNNERAASTILKEMYPNSDTTLLTDMETCRIRRNRKRNLRRSQQVTNPFYFFNNFINSLFAHQTSR